MSLDAQVLANQYREYPNSLDFWNHFLRRLGVFGLAVILHFLLAPYHSPAQGLITTVAGSGRFVFSDDGGSATNASLGEIAGIAVDAAGNVFAADYDNNLVVKISPAGVLTVVAGNGLCCSSGDDGPATSASLTFPDDVAVDAAGNLYIASFGRIRRVSPDGIIATVVVDGFSPNGLTVNAAGELYIADTLDHQIFKVNFSERIVTTVAGSGVEGFSGDGGPATSASLALNFLGLTGLAVDATGNLYVADTNNHRIRKVSPDGIITTIAGSGETGRFTGGGFSGDGGPAISALLDAPEGVAVDSAGNLYIADRFNFRIRKVSPDGTITTVAGNGDLGFSGDGGPAINASLSFLSDVAVDAAGNLYVADSDNYRVRKISPNGTITTIAGNGLFKFSGDGGPATSASLDAPFGVAVDSLGNSYIADTDNDAIRKVSPEGIITTVAGGIGVRGFSGDDGPATAAALNEPFDVAVDALDNLYIGDAGNNRIRKVGLDGTISTVAGNGVDGFSGDGGPATSASLKSRLSVAVDTLGNLYIADTFHNRIRKVSFAGIITTVAGDGFGGFSGDGDLSTRASLDLPRSVDVDATGNLYIADSDNDRIRKVLTTVSSFSVSPATLNFTAIAGSTEIPAHRITVSSPIVGLPWSTRASTETGVGWIALSAVSGFSPGTLSVFVSAASLEPGTYRGAVTVQSALASPPTQTVTIEFTVTPALPAQLAVESSSLTFEISTGVDSPPAQTLRISNAGGGTLDWMAQASTISGGNWLSVSPSSGSAPAGAPAVVQVSANVAGLEPAVYSGSVRVESPGSDPRSVAVTLLVSQVPQIILVSHSGLLFTGVVGGGIVPPQTFDVLNTGEGTMNWTVETSTTGGGNWLSVSPTSGTSEAASAQSPTVNVIVNMAGLPTGAYSGLIEVSAPVANNSPQFVTVTLNVLPAGSNPGVLVRPTGLIFTAQAGTSSPGSQTVHLATAGLGNRTFVSGLLTLDGGDWLEAVPHSGVVSAGDPVTITIQPTLSELVPAVYRAALTLLFADGSPTQVVDILFLVVAPSAGATSARLRSAPSQNETAEGCVPQRLLAVQRILGINFVSPVAWPSTIEAQVVDDCGNAVADAPVVASFSNGDPPLPLVSLRDGRYVGTWRPVNPAAQVTVTVQANLPPLVPVEVQVQGQVSSNPEAPALNTGGIVNAASFAPGEALAPGSIVSVFGSNLTQGQHFASQLPLETTLGGAPLVVGGVEQHLFFSSDGQINAQIPFELPANSRPQMVVRVQREGGAEAISVPETITIAEARPAIFTTNQQGTGQGAILNQDSSPNSAKNPEVVGNVIQVFSTGLGNTDPGVPSGQLAPSQEPLARVIIPVQAQIGGSSAAVQFAGLAPGFVGLYQVNVQIPAGVEPGSEIPLVLFQNGVPSNTVTVALQ